MTGILLSSRHATFAGGRQSVIRYRSPFCPATLRANARQPASAGAAFAAGCLRAARDSLQPQAPGKMLLLSRRLSKSVRAGSKFQCVPKFSIASARLTTTRTSTTALAKRPPRHLPHNPHPPKWTPPSELRSSAVEMLLEEYLADNCAKGSRQARQGHPRSRPHRYDSSILNMRKMHATRKDINGYAQAPAVA